MMEDAGPVCLGCADMDLLVFLASGDAALTRTGAGEQSAFCGGGAVQPGA